MNRKEQTEKFALDGIKLIILIIAVLSVFASFVSCTVPDDDILVLEEPTLVIDGRLPIDDNGYYHLELNQDTNQTIHTISGTIDNYELYNPLKVEWSSNLDWVYQDELVEVTNQSSYSIDGSVMNVIAPINTMVGDTLIVTGIIREHLISDTIKIVLE